jgi:hypothetical protein
MSDASARRPHPVLLAVLAVVACIGWAEEAAPRAAGDGVEVQPASPVILEFDLPDEFFAKNPDKTDVVTKFRVGYFEGGGAKPLATIEIPRSAVSVNGRSGRLTLPREQIPAAASGSLVVKLQTITRGGASDWSAASPMVATTTLEASARREPRRPEPRKRRGPSMADVERHPRLVEAFRETLSVGAKPEEVLASFRTTEELALAVVICREHKIPLEKLGVATQGPPRKSLSKAAREINPSFGGASALQKARADAKQLLSR